MHYLYVIDPDGTSPEGGEPQRPRSTSDLTALAVVSNAIFAGLATVFSATGSIMITSIAAGLVALLGLLVAFGACVMTRTERALPLLLKVGVRTQT
jgi:hypothetical protein